MYNVKTLKKLINNFDQINALSMKRGFSNLRLFKPINIIYQNKLHFLVSINNQDVSLFDLAKLKIDLADFLNLDSEDLIVLTEHSLSNPNEIIEKQFTIYKENFFEIVLALFENQSDTFKIDCLQSILESKEDQNLLKKWINTENKDKLYPTSIAVSKEQLPLLDYFLTTIKDDETIYKNLILNAVYVAAICGKTTVLQFLYNLKPNFELNIAIYCQHYPIQAAAVYGQLEAVKFLLDQHPDSIFLLTLSKERIIDLAAKSGNVELVKFLVDTYKIELDTCNEMGKFPIHYAASFNNPDLIKWLLEQGVNPEIETKEVIHLKPVHFAAEYGAIAALNELKKHIPNIHIANRTGLTPLYISIADGRKEMIEWLLQNGADIKQKTKDKYENNSFHIAAIYGRYDLLNLLMQSKPEQGDYNIPNVMGSYPLHYAAAGMSDFETDYTISLIRKEMKDEIAKSYRTTFSRLEKIKEHMLFPLYRFYRIFNNFLAIILDKYYPSDFFEKRFKWETIDYSYIKVIEWLLEQQHIDINQTTKDEREYTACHFSAASGQLEILQLLHHKKADINKIAKDGYSPIDLAVMCDQLSIIEWAWKQGILINCFSLPNIINNHTPLTLAFEHQSVNVIQFFIQNQMQVNEEIKKIIPTWKGLFNDWRPIHYISLVSIEDDPDEDHPDIMDLTAITSLLNSNIDINAVTLRNETIFHLLMQNICRINNSNKLDNYMRLISLLLKHGLDVHIRTHYTATEVENEIIKETGYDRILRNLIQDIKSQQIAISLLHIFKENGIYIDASAFVDYYGANFYNCKIKTEFLDFIIQHFPEIYTSILEKCTESLFSRIKSCFSVPPGLPIPPSLAPTNNENLNLIKKLIHYGFIVGRKLDREALDQLHKIISESVIYLAVGIDSSNILLPGKPIHNLPTLKVNEILVEDRLLFLNLLKSFLIAPLESFSEKNIYELKDLFCKLARELLLIETLSQKILAVTCHLLDKILPQPSKKLNNEVISDLTMLYRESYKKATKQLPSLITLCEDVIIRSPSFYVSYPSKQLFNKDFSFFTNHSKRIRENQEYILNKVHLLSDDQNETSIDEKTEIELLH